MITETLGVRGKSPLECTRTETSNRQVQTTTAPVSLPFSGSRAGRPPWSKGVSPRNPLVRGKKNTTKNRPEPKCVDPGPGPGPGLDTESQPSFNRFCKRSSRTRPGPSGRILCHLFRREQVSGPPPSVDESLCSNR